MGLPPHDIAKQVWASARPNRTVDDDGVVRRVGRALRRGVNNRRIIAEADVGRYEYRLHATKGWRRQRRY